MMIMFEVLAEQSGLPWSQTRRRVCLRESGVHGDQSEGPPEGRIHLILICYLME